jgi:hypothetical protein
VATGDWAALIQIDLALACLNEAIAAEYRDFDHIRQDTDLAPLHGLPEFEKLFPKASGKP